MAIDGVQFTDQYADGMCCAYGEGSYTILSDGDNSWTITCVQLVMVADNYPGEQTWSFRCRWC